MHSLAVKKLGLNATREAVTKKIHDIKFEPTGTDLGAPKEGEHDANNNPHHGGNRWAGGVSPLPFLWLCSLIHTLDSQEDATLLGKVVEAGTNAYIPAIISNKCSHLMVQRSHCADMSNRSLMTSKTRSPNTLKIRREKWLAKSSNVDLKI